MDSIPPGGLGSIYAGHLLACAAARGVLDAIEEKGHRGYDGADTP
jgi:4-aminobutyrate aminotransferase/4-aminobutyrate aminotransferase/(S)-3-amino-2-methylpropionate transaminase